jgi:error-prone DNA polymerase
MPEHPNPKLRDVPPPPAVSGVAAPPYAELDCVSNFSFLRGASHPDELIFRAAELGYRAIAIADVNTLAGIVRAHDAAEQCGMKLVIGARLTLQDGPDLLVYPTDRPAYGRLCRLLTLGKRRAEKGQCTLYLDDVLAHQEGLIVVCDANAMSNEYRGRPGSPTDLTRSSFLVRLKEAIGSRLSLAVSLNYALDNDTLLARMMDVAQQTGVPLVATNHVHYHDPGRRALQDVLTCVRHGCTIYDAGYRLFPNAERHLKPPGAMHRLFAACPEAIDRALEIAERCRFHLSELQYEYPNELVPAGMTAMEYLTRIAWEGARSRYPQGIPAKVRTLIEHELALIAELKFEAYFLTVYDLVTFARSRGILCQGRGSAANSAVCYCIGVTSVDPSKHDLLFERFVSRARKEPPDIDIDFEHERREEVIQYIYQKYGRDRAGMTAEVISYRGRSAVRDVGKAMGLGLDAVDSMAKRLDWWHHGTLTDVQIREAGLDPADANVRRIVALTGELLGFPRHLGQHVGGMVMTRGPLCEMVPIENASMEGRTVIEWDKDDIDRVGILKVDCLALGMLTCISKAFRMLEREMRGTEGLRDLGTKGREDHRNGRQDTIVSGSDCVAEGNGTGTQNLSGNPADAARRTIRADQSDAQVLSVRAFEHRRRVWATGTDGLHSVSQNGEGIARGVGHPVRTGNLPDDAHARLHVAGTSPRNGTHPSIAHLEFGEQGLNDFEEGLRDLGTKGLREGASFPLSPLVPQSLSPSLPPSLELHTIPDEDPAVYDMICNADTVGVFQIESRAQMSMLPRLRPRCFYDLVIEVAIVRPGPIQGNMVHPYLRRRNGEEPVTYPSEALRDVLRKTLGVPLFQEQAMRVAMVGAGFSAEEADQLRRAMAAWRRGGTIEKFHEKILRGMVANGYTLEFAEQCYQQIKGFGEYGFPESHAASFALLVYASSWIKRYSPAVFCAALLNSQPMGFYAPAQIVRDAQNHGVEVRAVDVNASEWDCTLEKKGLRDLGTEGLRAEEASSLSPFVPQSLSPCSVRLGFRMIKGMRKDHAERIVAARRAVGRFASVEQFHRLTGLPVSAIKRLAEADAFASLPRRRRESFWDSLELHDESAPLFESTISAHPIENQQSKIENLPVMSVGQEVMTDYITTGLSLKRHPVSLVRDELKRRKIMTAAEMNAMPHGAWVSVSGLVLIRQRPGTASGIVFETLEDETGIVNLIIRPNVYEKYRAAARHGTFVRADGRVERQGQVVHLMARRITDLSELLAGYEFSSRDFH